MTQKAELSCSSSETNTDKTYNGWANHATWLVNLWLGEYNYDPSALSGLSRYDATQALKETVDNILTEYDTVTLSGLAADLINSALSDVDWYELADSYLKDCEAETEENGDE